MFNEVTSNGLISMWKTNFRFLCGFNFVDDQFLQILHTLYFTARKHKITQKVLLYKNLHIL